MKFDFQPIQNTPEKAMKFDFQPIQSAAASQQSPTFLGKLANNPVTNAIVNLGGGISHGILAPLADLESLPHAIYSKIPAVNAPSEPFSRPQSLLYQAGNVAGTTVPFIAGGAGLDAVRGAAEGLPLVGKAADWLGGQGMAGVTRRALGAGAYGAFTNPNHPIIGAGIGAVASPVADAVPGVAKVGRKAGQLISSAFNPQQKADEILDFLSGGQTRENAGKSVATDIHNLSQQELNNGHSYYNSLSDLLNSSRSDGLKLTNFNALPDPVTKVINSDVDLGPMADALKSDPSFENFQNLKSQIGQEVSALTPKNTTPDPATRTHIKLLGKASTALDGDLNDFLSSVSPEAQNLYQTATNNWRENVVPFRKDPQIYQMASGQLQNPANVHNIFKNPEPSTLSILNKLPDETKNKIMFSYLGKINTAKNPQKLLDTYDSAINDGLESSITPQLQSHMDDLSKIITRAKVAQDAAGLATGAAIGAHVGDLEVAPILGALAGKIVAKPAMNVVRAAVRSKPLRAIGKGVVKSYSPSAKAALANAIQSPTINYKLANLLQGGNS